MNNVYKLNNHYMQTTPFAVQISDRINQLRSFYDDTEFDRFMMIRKSLKNF